MHIFHLCQLGENIFYLKQKVENDLATKANKADIYTKTDTDGKYVLKATTISGYNISDAYTKTQVDSKTGDLTTLKTIDKTQLVKSINEVYDNTKGVVSLYDKNVAAGAGANGWSDLLIKLANGRTQADKNQDFISTKDFGCVGDGVTDDSQNLAKAIKFAYENKRTLDGLGLTYA
jgi:hypothetical protein